MQQYASQVETWNPRVEEDIYTRVDYRTFVYYLPPVSDFWSHYSYLTPAIPTHRDHYAELALDALVGFLVRMYPGLRLIRPSSFCHGHGAEPRNAHSVMEARIEQYFETLFQEYERNHVAFPFARKRVPQLEEL